MFCSVLSATIYGVDAVKVQVEADVSDGMPQFVMVGSVSMQVKEGQDRAKTALRNVGVVLPRSGLPLVWFRQISGKRDPDLICL